MASVTPVNTARVQTCPHGLSPGACPVCSGMGGGGVQKRKETPKQEMSYNEMYAIWLQIKAAQAHKLEAKENLQKEALALQNTQRALANMAEKLLNVLNKIQNILPKPIANIFAATVNNILRPIVNIIKNFPNFVNDIQKFIQNIQREVYIVAEKLASVFGEIKNFIQKQVSNTFKKFTKKVYKILNIFGLEYEEDFEEDEKASAEIQAFKTRDVKNLKEFILEMMTKKEEEIDRRL